MKLSLIAAGLITLSTTALAQTQSYMIQRPGQPPIIVNPMPNGSTMIQTPGKLPTFVNPTANGNYIVHTPGKPPIVINRLGHRTGQP